MTVSGKSARGIRVTSEVSHAATSVGDHPVVTAGARAGYAVSGLLHLLIAWLGLQIAFGGSGTEADPSGAMALVATTRVGFAVLVATDIAFALLAVWQVTEGIRGPGAGDRVKAWAKALVYGGLAWSATTFVMGVGQSSDQQANGATMTVMRLPYGAVLVVAGGFVVVGVGIYHVYKGAMERFRTDLQTSPSHAIMLAGKVGYVAKGIALIAVGIGIVVAGLSNHPSSSRGLDGALHDMVALPWGQAVVTLVAAGFAAYGLYSFSRARRARV